MTHQDRDGEDDWGSATDWQRPAQQPPPGNPGWTQSAADQPPQGYGNVPLYGGQPIYGQPPAHHPALPPHYPQGWPPVAPPNNYLAPAILVTLLCMPFTGVAAIYFSNQVNAKHNVGDLAGALDASNKAKMWCFVSLAAGVVAWLLILGGSNSGY
jgi:hypothetical protein